MFLPRAISPFVKKLYFPMIFPPVRTAALNYFRQRVRMRHEHYKLPFTLVIGLPQWGFCNWYGDRVVTFTSCCHFILRWEFLVPYWSFVLFSEALPPYFVHVVVLVEGCAYLSH